LNLVWEDASSTSEVIFFLLEALGVKITKDIAFALYTGISADSGSFRYSCTSERTFEVAKRLLAAGVNLEELNTQLYGRESLAAVRLHADVLSNLRLHFNDRVCEMVIPQGGIERFGAKYEDADNLVEKGRDIDGVLIAYLIRWDGEIWRVSLRSKTTRLDVSKVAQSFGGGGHKASAAFRWRKSLEELRSALLKSLGELADSKEIAS